MGFGRLRRFLEGQNHERFRQCQWYHETWLVLRALGPVRRARALPYLGAEGEGGWAEVPWLGASARVGGEGIGRRSVLLLPLDASLTLTQWCKMRFLSGHQVLVALSPS